MLEGKESVLRELERQKTHFEAKAALQEHSRKLWCPGWKPAVQLWLLR